MKINAASILSSKINKGLQHIHNRDYDPAINIFTDKSLAEITGYNLQAQCMRLINQRTLESKERISEVSDQAASLSGISPSRKVIDIFRVDADLKTPELKECLEMEIMLLHAEEWLHVLKELTGGDSLSSHSPKIYSYKQAKDFYPNEIEVADYFLDRGIPYNLLDTTRWFERYDRKNVLTEVLEKK